MDFKIPLFKTYWDQNDIDSITKVVKRGTYWAAGPEIQEFENEIAKYAVTSALADISQEMGENEGRGGIKSLDSLSKIMELAATFKDEGFSEEQEARIVARAEEGGDSIKFRHKCNKLIPYFEAKISLDCIKAISV